MIMKEDAYRLAAINRLLDQLVRSSPKPVDVEVVNRLLHKYDTDPNFGVREFTAELQEMLA